MSEYKERVIKQSLRWVGGIIEHNYIDNECCFDFSCCHPDLYTHSQIERINHHNSLIKRLRGNK